jgi:hypothetical protein
MKLSKSCQVVAVLVLASQSLLLGQSPSSARSLGMAGSYLTLASNCEAASVNPANLALPGRKNYSLKLFSLSGQASNNSFSLADYNKYNGAYLTTADKEDILAKIPQDGLALDFVAAASALSFSVGAFAVTAEVVGGGKGTLPKDPIELALMGNKIGEPVTADGSGGAGWGAAAIGLSYGRKIVSLHGWDLAAGGSFKYLRGLNYYAVEGLSAQAVTLATGFAGSGGLTTIESQGGSGYAVDLGFTAQGTHAQYGLVFRNLLATINWNRQLAKTVYAFHFENVTVDNAGDDSLWTSEESQAVIGAFRSRPPLEVELGGSRRFGKLLTSVNLRQGFEKAAFVSKNPRLALGVEYPALKVLDLRSGLAVGGADDFSAAAGLGLNLGPFHLDLAYASSSRIVPWGGKGGQFAVSTILDF